VSTKFKIDTENRTVFVKRNGLISPGEPTDAMQKITIDSDFKNINKLLSDLSKSDLSAISNEEWSRHAEFCKKIFKNLTAVAIVAPTDHSFGISRWFELSSGLENVMVFRDIKDALKWIEANNLPEDFNNFS